tara:strand:- start:1118 stop:1834 length:717 start_codon:yes stop_codon:yes gene_type:complete
MAEQELPEGFKMTGTAPVPEGTKLDGDAMARLAEGKPPDEVLAALAEAEEEPMPDVDSPVAICPRCGWDVDRDEYDEITTDDKKRFVRTVLGGGRYTKKRRLLGGALEIVFRSVKPNEMDCILKQLREDSNNGKISGEAEYLVYYSRYMLTCSLQSVGRDKEGQNFVTLDEVLGQEVEKALVSEDVVTPLPALYASMAKDWQEGLHAILMVAMRQFEKEYDVLIHRAYSPDFWSATAG